MITINQQRLNEVLEPAKQFKTVIDVENDIAELVQAYKTISEAYDSLKQSFTDSDYDSIEGDKIKVSKYQSGQIYLLKDPKVAPPELLELKLNTKAVAEYVKEKNVLPQGIEEKSRSTSVRISLK